MTLFGENLLRLILIYGGKDFLILMEKNFSEIAVKIFSVPTSSAAIERNFSSEARIHTKRRNTLSNECVEKLLAIQFNSRKGINCEGLSS